jgi:hypothetical protein
MWCWIGDGVIELVSKSVMKELVKEGEWDTIVEEPELVYGFVEDVLNRAKRVQEALESGSSECPEPGVADQDP